MASPKLDISDIEFPKGCPKVEFYRHPQYYEITCSLFTKCNLNCEFCSQEHVTDLDESKVIDIAFNAFEVAKKDIIRWGVEKLEVRFWGGELFSDNIPTSYFIVYDKFISLVRELFTKEFPGIDIEFITTTNGVLTNHGRLISFLKAHNMNRVSVSYDYIGRYKTEHQRELALNTIKRLSDEGFKVNVGIILTKRAINHILNKPTDLTDFFNEYSADSINFNFYIPNKGWEQEMPSDDDMWSLYKFLIDNELYRIKTIYYLFETKANNEYIASECECKYLPNIFEGGVSKNCIQCFSNLGNKLFYGSFSNKINDENVSDVKASLGMVKRGCLQCKYHDICQMPCWSSVIFKHFQPTECPLQKSYEYITEEQLERYKQWRSSHHVFN